MADWLHQCGVTTVAMESTRVYWLPVYEVLESRGFEVKLVNAHYVKTVPGRKTDVRLLSMATTVTHLWLIGRLISSR